MQIGFFIFLPPRLLIFVGEGHCHLKMCIFLNLNTHLSQQYASNQGFTIMHISDCKYKLKTNSFFFLKYTCSAFPSFNENWFLRGYLLPQIRALQPINSFNVGKHLLYLPPTHGQCRMWPYPG